MAVTTNNFTWDPNNIVNVAQPIGSAIQGKSIGHQITITDVSFENIADKDLIKKDLVQGLVEKMMQEKCIEFTMQDDHFMGAKICRARIFVVPDTQVRILREKGVI